MRFQYNGFHGRSYHRLYIRPWQKTSRGIRLTRSQLSRHRVCEFHDCLCGESIAVWDGDTPYLKPIGADGVMRGNYPQD